MINLSVFHFYHWTIWWNLSGFYSGLEEDTAAATMSTMKFCREWYAPFYIDHLPLSCIRLIIQLLDDGWTCSNNILYPKEDRDRRTLFFACRNCEHQVQLVNLYPCSTNKSNPIFLLYPSSAHHQYITTRMVFGHSTWMMGFEWALKCLLDGVVPFFSQILRFW